MVLQAVCIPVTCSKHPRAMNTIRPVHPEDASEWLRMRLDLWPEGSEAEHHAEIQAYFEAVGNTTITLVCEREDGGLGGFAEVAIRDGIEGAEGEQVGYLEGWYVDADLRKKGVGRALVDAAEAWTRAQGLTVMGSDVELHNAISIQAHKALGFHETYRLVHFMKRL